MDHSASPPGPKEWKALHDARNDPELIHGLLHSDELAAMTAGLTPEKRFTTVNNALTTLLAEPVYWHLFADSMERILPSDPHALIQSRVDLTAPGADPPFDLRTHPAQHRADQTRYMQTLVGMFESAYLQIYEPDGGPSGEEPGHPYYPIRAAQLEFRAEQPQFQTAGATPPPSLRTLMQGFARQQFLTMLFLAERIMGAWAALTAEQAERETGARLPAAVSDFAPALLHNLPLVLQTMRTAPLPLDSITLGIPTRRAQDAVSDRFGEEAKERFLADYLRRQSQDFTDDLSWVRRWDTAAGTTLPDVGLRLMPTREDTAAGTTPSGFGKGRKGRCPAPEPVSVPAALALIAPRYSAEGARHAVRKVKILRGSGVFPGRGSPRADDHISIAELAWITCAVRLETLIAGRTTAAGIRIAPGPSWTNLAQRTEPKLLRPTRAARTPARHTPAPQTPQDCPVHRR